MSLEKITKGTLKSAAFGVFEGLAIGAVTGSTKLAIATGLFGFVGHGIAEIYNAKSPGKPSDSQADIKPSESHNEL